jgi:hypothetical protein
MPRFLAFSKKGAVPAFVRSRIGPDGRWTAVPFGKPSAAVHLGREKASHRLRASIRNGHTVIQFAGKLLG